MKQYEREYFVSRIRSGIYIVKHSDLKLKVMSPTLEDEFEANQIYMETYYRSMQDGIKTLDEMQEWMKDKGLWTDDDDEREEGLKKDLDRLRIEIYKARNNESNRETIRKYIRAGEEQQLEHLSKKYLYQENTCEGLAMVDKTCELIRLSTYFGKELFDFSSLEPRVIWNAVNKQLCKEKDLREMARSEPWRTTWILQSSGGFKLFHNHDRELTTEQKNLLVWSKMYDNIQESMDCPSDDVIEDDDMLDGWFLIQKQKREQEKAEAEFDKTMNNPKLSDVDDIFLMAGSKQDAEHIDNMNTTHGKMVKKERAAAIKHKGSVEQHEFRDEQLRARRQSNQQFKDKFGR